MVVPLLPSRRSLLTQAQATAVSPTDVHIAWATDYQNVATSFTIFRQGPTDGTSYNPIATLPAGATSYDDLTAVAGTTYSYQVAPNNDPQSTTYDLLTAPNVTTPVPSVKPQLLTGTPIGTGGSYRNQGNTIARVFDGNLNTFFDGPTGSGNWVGLDLGTPQAIAQITFAPRAAYSSRMVGGTFQASNTQDFSSGVVTLFTVSSAPKERVLTTVNVKTTSGYRYVRYVSPTNGCGNIAELAFTGLPATALPVIPSVPVTTPFPTSITWSNGAPSPIIRAEAVGGSVNGILYVFGGFNDQGSDTTSIPLQHECDAYNPATNTWTRLQDFPEPFTHSQEVIVGSNIWFVGGYLGNHPGPGTKHVWIYDTLDDSWSRGPDLPQARGAGAAALVGNTIYFAGGMDQSRTIDENTTWALDTTNQSAGWVQLADLPNGRNHVAAAGLGGYFYVIGGQHQQEDGQLAQSEVDRYDPSTDTWQQMASLPTAAGKSHITSGTLVYDGRIIVVGGETGYNDPQRYIVDYDPSTDTWNQLGLLPAARSTVVAGIVNGQLVVTTGNAPDPTTTTWIGSLS